MEEVDKRCLMIRMGVSRWMFLLVPAHPGISGQRAIKRLCVCLCVRACACARACICVFAYFTLLFYCMSANIAMLVILLQTIIIKQTSPQCSLGTLVFWYQIYWWKSCEVIRTGAWPEYLSIIIQWNKQHHMLLKQYDMTWCAILRCAQKLTWVTLIYCRELTTKSGVKLMLISPTVAW